MPTDDAAAWRTWRDAAARPEIDAALHRLHARLDADVQARGPICWTSGKCCRFDSYGHRMYVTALEIAWMLRLSPLPARSMAACDPNAVALPQYREVDGCPYQVDGLCSVHEHRPLGCRIFFCQQGTQQWQQQLYESYLSELRAIHERFDLPYRYLEWRAGLDEALMYSAIQQRQ